MRLDHGTNLCRPVGTRFTGGRLVHARAGFGDPSALRHTGCIEEGVAREVPADSARVATGGNLTL